MQQLTIQEMKAAIFTRMCDVDDHNSGIAAARYIAEQSYNWKGQLDERQYRKNIEAAEAEYKLGKSVLKSHTLRYTDRSTVHTYANGRTPGQDNGRSGFLRVTAGYVGSMQAYQTAVFNPRK